MSSKPLHPAILSTTLMLLLCVRPAFSDDKAFPTGAESAGTTDVSLPNEEQQQEKTQSPAPEKEQPQKKGKRDRYKGKVQYPSTSASTESKGSSEEIAQGQLMYFVCMENSDTGFADKSQVLYSKESGLTQEGYRRLLNSPLVENRKNEWHQWYSNIFDSIKPKSAIPATVRLKINVTIDKKGKVYANTEWTDPTTNPEALKFAENLLSSIKALEGRRSLAFPEKSWLELVKFDIEASHFQDDFRLMNHNPTLDYDPDNH